MPKQHGKVRPHLCTFPEHPDDPPDNNGSERELPPTATDTTFMRFRLFVQPSTGILSFNRVE